MHKDEITDRLYLIAEAIDVIIDRCIKYKHEIGRASCRERV